MELDNKVYNSITELCAQGDKLIEKGDINNAISTYKSALALVPIPKSD